MNRRFLVSLSGALPVTGWASKELASSGFKPELSSGAVVQVILNGDIKIEESRKSPKEPKHDSRILLLPQDHKREILSFAFKAYRIM